MQEFIRVEKDGIGPYSYSDEYGFDWMTYDHHDCIYTPPIHDDSGFTSEDKMIYDLNCRKKGCLSGFTSLEQMENWFSLKELEILKKEGFQIKFYNVKNIFDSGKQAFILKEDILEEI